MSVTAKVVVASRVDATWGAGSSDMPVAQLTFGADYADDANKAWAAATPSLYLSMTVKREIADAHFPLGRKLTLTFND